MTKQPNISELHSAACKLYEAGFSVIPLVHGRKRPAVSWEQYQHRRATINEINSWWSARNAANPYGLGVVTGSVSSDAVLDIDPARGHTAEELIAEAEEAVGNKFPTTCCVGTCGDSCHMHFKATKPTPTTIIYQSPTGKIELRGDGAVVVMPPTVAYSDRTSAMGQYVYVTPLSDRIALEDTWIYQLALEKKRVKNSGPPPDMPSEDEISTTVTTYLPLLPQTAKNILTGKDVPEDRSKQCYHLACELVRSGIRDQRTLATIIMAAPYHQQKYGPRPKNSAWGEWGHALALADKALAEVTKNSPARQQPASAATPNKPEGHKQDPAAQRPAAVAFPNSAAIGICADIATMFASVMEAPFEFWYVAALTCLGTAISGCVTLDTALAPQPRLYTAIIGPTAVPRKSTAINMTVDFFEKALEPLEILDIEPGLGSAEGLASIMKRDDGQPSRCLILLDELRVFVQKARIEHSALLPMLCSMYHGNSYANATKHTRIKFRNAHIGMLGACTEDTFSTMWTPEFIAIGFLNRLLLVPGQLSKSVALPDPIPQEEKDALAGKLRRLVEEVHQCSATTLTVGNRDFKLPGNEPRRLRLTDDAKTLWETWYADRPTGVHANRLDDLGLRLLILSEVSRGNLQTVELDTVERVLKLLDWQYQVRRVYDPIDADSKMAAMEQRIKRALRAKGSLTGRELRQYTNADRAGLWVFKSSLQNLLDEGIIGKIQRGRTHAYILSDSTED